MGALAGLKILDFSTLLPGPFATLMLADMGAEVLKVSSKSKADIVIDYPPFVEGTEISVNQAWLGRNKKTISLNLKDAQSIEIIKKLILEYDIVMEQFRPGVMEKLGLGYETLKAVNPELIYCSLTGYGQTGPLKMKAGHDINYLSRSGNMAQAGRKSTGPVLTNMQIADVAVGSMNSVIGILAAVHYRNNTGKGQQVDVSMYDGLIPFNSMDGAAFLATGKEPGREEERLNGGCIYDFYETKDGKYLSVGCLEPKFWNNFCTCIGRPEYIEGTVWPADIAEVKADIISRIKEKSLKDWMEIFNDKDVCVEPVLNLEEALIKDEHMQARKMVVDVVVPESEGKTVKQLGSPIKLSECPIEYKQGGYPIGYHTYEVIEQLGFTKEQIKEMEKKGVFR
ncbi:CaiB/BaiF CoA transferase family protein [Aminipila sp.]|uniref:CaiB/BaiF CoA transferase family protein n=1 Tax=Aminipila sp. TaxID=2060095 RepID=UPI0028A2B27B|nr:CaiB/BaiF CoA-transferase family protein [Aminipila sp.]